MKDDRPWAAVVRMDPMLCTRCAALAGCWMIHHRTNATAAHVRTVLSFTAASLEAQTSPSSQYPFILARNLAWMWVQADAVLAMLVPNGCSMPGTSRRYACLVESMPPRGEACSRRRPTGSSHVAERARTCWPARSAPIFPATHSCIRTFRFLDVPRSDNIPPCRACLGHGDA